MSPSRLALVSSCALALFIGLSFFPSSSTVGSGVGMRTRAIGPTMVAKQQFRSFSPSCPRSRVFAIPPEGVPGTNEERTFIAIKPDGVQRRHIGEIIGRFEKKGFKLVGMKFMTPTKGQAEGHYDNLRGKPFFNDVAEYFSSGPICAMVWEGKNVITTGRKMLGATNPAESVPGTIRGDLCIEVGRNVCHGSDGPESAMKEISYWFAPSELMNWGCSDAGWIYENPAPVSSSVW
mmetsp:Transcript_9941/g.15692  ORF Transcript_9941/g.15692 Transcript_9941/m.15692 type:complete len:234 (-) Transcript_9941:140-841(-)